MMKKFLIGATLAAAALASTQLLADPGHGRRGQNTPCTGASCPAATTEGHAQHGQNARGQGMHAQRHGKGGHGAQRGHQGEGCPMHAEKKPA
jgi:hypothetical protein